MSRVIFTITLAVILLFGAVSKGQDQRTRNFDFESYAEGLLPEEFEAGMTGKWKSTEWSVRSILGNQVLAHIGFWNEDPDGVFPVCWVKDSRARDLSLTVRLLPVRPPAEIPMAVHDGAGIVVRFRDPDNYYLLRAVPHEARVRLYKVEKGSRSTLAGKDLGIAVDKWHVLKLGVKGSLFTAYFDGEELFTYQDETFTDPGAFGLWSKPNNVTYFDDFKAEITR